MNRENDSYWHQGTTCLWFCAFSHSELFFFLRKWTFCRGNLRRWSLETPFLAKAAHKGRDDWAVSCLVSHPVVSTGALMYLSPEQWTALQSDVKREDFPHKQHNYSPHAHARTPGVCGPAGQSEASRSTLSVNGCLGWEKDSPCGWRGGSCCFGLRVGRCFIWSGATAFVPLNEFAAGSLNFMSQWEIDDDFFFFF